VLGAESIFLQKLRTEERDGAYDALFDYVKLLSPAALDLEIRSSLGALDTLSLFVHALTQRLKAHRDFEAVQAMMGVFLRVHGEILVQNQDVPELMDGLKELKAVQKKETARIVELLASSLGTLGFVRESV